MSESLTIRVSRSTHGLPRDLAAKTNTTMTAVVDQAVRDLQRKRFWEEFQTASEALKADPKALADYRQEMAEWDVTLADGLEMEPPFDDEEPRLGRLPKRELSLT